MIDMSNRRKTLVVVAILLGTFLASLDGTVVGTAMPTIIGALGGMAIYSWVFSAYLLTSTTTVPIYGKLADLFGRKPVFITAAGLFILGSALSGLSHSMEQLIAFRAIQGLGAGGILPVTMTLLGDLFTLQQRARMQAVFSAVWGVSAVVGPAIGGVIVAFYGWPWVFYVNLPMGILSMVLLAVTLKEPVDRRREPVIDFRGVLLLSAGIVALLLGLLEGGIEQPWFSPSIIGLLGSAAILIVAFVAHELRVPEPIVPIRMFLDNRVMWSSNAAGFLIGMAMMGVSSYIPLFAQGVQGGTAMAAGALLAPMSLGWPIAGALSAPLLLRIGFRAVAIAGGILVLAGSVLLTRLVPESSQTFAMATTFTIGLGMGFATNSTLLAVQNSVGWAQRGIATSSVQFFRMMGNAIGVAVLGSILNSELVSRLPKQISASGAASDGLAKVNALLDPVARAAIDLSTLSSFERALAGSLNVVFWTVVVFAVLGIAATWFMPRGRVQELAAKQETIEVAS